MSRQTQPRQNYHEESEAAVNRQINLELYASYVYMSMVRSPGESPRCNASFNPKWQRSVCCMSAEQTVV